jgi:nitrogenase molybdenum-iron protein alpha chain
MSGVEREPVTVEGSKKVVEGMLKALPKKTGEIRKKHVVVKDACEVEQRIEANDRTIPGILTNRGCAYAGSKGVVFGPVKDILHITHGPIGCAYFTWGMRRNLMSQEEGKDCFAGYCLSTDVKETDIVFGSEKKLAQAIREAYAIFKPECISVFAPAQSGIGDDIESVCKKAKMTEDKGNPCKM